MNGKLDEARLVSAAVAGLEFRAILVNDKSYIITPPTVARLAGATYWLCELGDGATLRDMLGTMSNLGSLARALSWFIQSNDELHEELAQGTLKELVDGLEAAFSMVGVEDFIRLSVLRRSARTLIAKPR